MASDYLQLCVFWRAGLSFYAVAVHEFGHSLGLSHSSVEGAIMFPYYQPATDNYTLSHDDIIGIQAIYGASSSVAFSTSFTTVFVYVCKGRRDEGARVPIRPPPARPTTPTTTPTKAETPTKATPATKKPLVPGAPQRPSGSPTPSTPKPNTCDTNYDAISVIRSEVFVFKGDPPR